MAAWPHLGPNSSPNAGSSGPDREPDPNSDTTTADPGADNSTSNIGTDLEYVLEQPRADAGTDRPLADSAANSAASVPLPYGHRHADSGAANEAAVGSLRYEPSQLWWRDAAAGKPGCDGIDSQS